MKTNAYRIIWADDEIDSLLDTHTINELSSNSILVVGKAHNGEELEKVIDELTSKAFDAVIVDANYNVRKSNVESERDITGLEHAMSIYEHKLNKSIPFFLFTNRTDELLREKFEYNPRFNEIFPRYTRWFNKSGEEEFEDMLKAIKEEIELRKSPSFIVTNLYQEELKAAKAIDNITHDYIFDFLINENTNTLNEMKEPFIGVRRAIEKIFKNCSKKKLIPPIDNDINGTADYLLNKRYKKNGNNFRMNDNKQIIEETPARAMNYMVEIVQDAAHSKEGLKYKVDEYWNETHDTLFLKSIIYILMDCLKWYKKTSDENPSKTQNERSLWSKVF